MEAQLGIMQENMAEVAHALNQLLADEYVLYTKTRKAHWNVESKEFYSLHKLFEEQYQQLDQVIDDTAERIRALGHYASATLHEFLELTHLSEQSRKGNDGTGYIEELLESHESVIIHIRKIIDRMDKDLADQGTNDFLTGLLKVHEKTAWMLRAHLK